MTAKHKTYETNVVLLDAHAILHRAYHALPDFTAPDGEPTGALYGVVTMLLKAVEELNPDYIIACYDLPEPTYRHTAYADYKAGRKKTDDELARQIERSRDIFAAFGIPIYQHAGFEADDILGTIAATADTDLAITIASGDMDTLQLVEGNRVRVYTLKRGIKDTIIYDEDAVRERFGFDPTLLTDYKGLRGDPSDNIPGVQGIGEKTATELITRFGSIDDIYATLKTDPEKFENAGIKPRIVTLLTEHEEEAQFSKMLATIRRDAPIEFSLPEKAWPEGADADAVLTLFSELGFRSLASRVKDILNIDAETSLDQAAARVDDAEVAEAGVMLWLIDSERTNPDYDAIIDYGRSQYDTQDFYEIVAALKRELDERNLTDIFTEIEQPLMTVIDHMNTTGVCLDVSYLKDLSKKFHKELSKHEQTIYTQAGAEFNINSPKQLGEVLYDTLGLKPKNQKRTASGQRSTRESELVKMKDDHEIIPAILRYRELQKLLSTYIDSFPKLVDDDGRLRTTFLQTGTTTGRIASKDPNLQNIPIRSDEGRAMRRGFVAADGYEMVSIDYSQIDLRMAAILSGDTKLIEIFKNGEDVHTSVAAQVFDVPHDDVTKDMRRRAKVINFGILYGMGVNALRQNLGADATRNEAQEFLNAYFNTFTRLAEYLEEVKAFAREHGYTTTLFGRRRYFSGINSSAPFIRAHAERMAINAPVQGTAADVMRIAMNRVYEEIKSNNQQDTVRMMLQVHDEIVFEVQSDMVEDVVPTLVAIMESVLQEKDTHGVPLTVDVAAGANWTDLNAFGG